MKRKVASRFLLPTEMLVGLISIMVGLAGELSEGVLFRTLLDADEVLIWVLSFCVVGCSQFLAAIVEWQCGRSWRLDVIGRFAALRLCVAFLSGACWLVATMYLVVAAKLMISLTFVSPICLAFAAWSYVENYKVKDALDATVSTDTIVFHR